ncbi:MAG: hypothetical protein Q4F41_00225 [Eubacteriales bacterium]|nr:hypothetical protein [Eubacteriales bacterium]
MGYRCPTCGKSNLKIQTKGTCVVGYCDACGEWKGLEGEKAAQNRLIEELKEEKRKEEVYERASGYAARANEKKSWENYQKAITEFSRLGDFRDAQKKAEECRRAAAKLKKGARRKKEFLALIVLLAAAGAVFAYLTVSWFPSKHYEKAEALYAQGDYAGALEEFEAGGNYQDSRNQAVLCNALLALQKGDPDNALESVMTLEEENGEKLASLLKTALTEAAADWQANGISPETLLSLLAQQDVFDAEGSLDAETLALEAHLELAGKEDLIDWYVTEDGELAVLRTDGSAELFQMTESGNEAAAMDRASLADCLLAFGSRLLESDPECALQCNLAALSERPDSTAREASVTAYQQCAAAHEAEGDYDSAIQDAKDGFQLSPVEETFRFYVETMQRSCAAEEDPEQGIALWRAFCEEESSSFSAYEMEEEISAYAGTLCMEYALSLASWCDEQCLEWFAQAKEEGADLKEALGEAVSYFPVGRTRMELWNSLLKEYEDEPEEYQSQKALLTEELAQILDGSTAALTEDRLMLFLWGAEQGILPETIDVQSLYRAALEEKAGTEGLKSTAFADWDGDGWPDLIGLNGDGCLADYHVSAEQVTCSIQEESGFSKIEIMEREQFYILAENEAQTAFTVYQIQGGTLVRQFTESEAVHFSRTDFVISYDCLLEGSIPRYQKNLYEIGVQTDQAVCQEISWPEEDYPLPESVQDAMTQAMEACALELWEEFALLTTQSEADSWMAYEALETLPKPVFPLQMSCSAYWAEDGQELVRAEYEAEDGTAAVRYFALEEDAEGIWRLCGASRTPMQTDEWTEEGGELPLLCLNTQVQDTLQETGENRTYEILLPYDAKVTLFWQSGDADGTKVAYQIVLNEKENPDEPLFCYSLKASAATQQSRELFLDAGVYQLSVTAGKEDFGDYTLKLQAEAGLETEHEPNDTVAQASTVPANTEIQAVLSEQEDIDIYAFTLEEQAAVSIGISSEEAQSFSVKLADGDSYQLLRQSTLAQGETTEATYLAAGSYLVQVEAGDTWTGAGYCLEIHTETAADCEAEPNNTAETATPISTNQVIQADSAVKGDVDYYSFTLEGAGLIGVSLNFPATESEKETYTALLLSEDGTELWNGTAAGKDGALSSEPVILPQGTYRLKVENPTWNQNGYTVYISEEAVLAEAEPNDLLKEAAAIEPGSTVYGSLLSVAQGQEQDVDNYTFTLGEPGSVTLRLEFEEQSSASSVCQITLADEALNVLWSNAAKGNAQLLESGKLWLDAGTYLVQLSEGRQELKGVYRLTMDFEQDANGECEPNEEQPTALAFGQTRYGSFGSEDDIDRFSVVLEEQTTVRLTCGAADGGEGSMLLTLCLADQEGTLWSETFAAEEGAKSYLLQIPAGTYVLQAESKDGWDSAWYTLGLEKAE